MKQLRAVILGDFDNYLSYFTYGALEGAIRAGIWTRPVPLFNHDLKMIENQIMWFKPHMLLCHCIFNRDGRDNVFAMLRKIKNSGTVIFYHLGDARTEPRYPYDISNIVSAVLLNQNDTKKFENIWKVPCYKWPYPCLYQYGFADPIDVFKCRMAFTGSLSNIKGHVHSERTNFIGQLSRKIPIRIFPDANTGNTRFQTAELASSANMILGYQMTNIDGYLDVRPYQYIGAGALYLHNKCSQMDEVFIRQIHYLAYDSVEEIEKLYNYYVVQNPNKGKVIRMMGFEYCQKNHSTKQRMEFVIDKYKELIS